MIRSIGKRSYSGLCGELGLVELERSEPRIEPTGTGQLVVAALLDDAALVHHHDPVRSPDRRKAVGDDQRGTGGHQPVERILDQPLAFGIQRRGGFVEQQNRRVAQQGAGDGHALALTAGKARAVLAEESIQALRQVAQESFGIGGTGSLPDRLVRGVPIAVAQVVARRGGEQHALLRDERKAAAHIGGIGRGERHAVQLDGAGLRIVEPLGQLEQGGLAGAGGADDGNGLAWLDGQREVVQRGLLGPGRVAEGDMLERQLAASRRQGHRARGRGDSGLFMEQFVEPARRARAAHQIAVDLGQRAEGARHQGAGDHEGRDRAAGDRARRHAQRAAPHQQGQRAEDQEHDHCGHDRADADPPLGRGEGPLDCGGEAFGLAMLLVEGLDDLARPQHFGDQRADLGHAVLAGARDGAQAAAEPDDRQHDEDDARDQPQGQRRLEVEQVARPADRHDRVAQCDRNGRADDLLDQRGVGGHPRGYLPRAVFLEEAGREAQEVALHRQADVGDDALAQPGHGIEPYRRAQRQDDDNYQQVLEPAADVARIATAREAAVDDQAKARRDRQGRRGRHQQRQGCGQHPAGIGHCRSPDHPERAEAAGGTLQGRSRCYRGGRLGSSV
jgi:hypothetical protein